MIDMRRHNADADAHAPPIPHPNTARRRRRKKKNPKLYNHTQTPEGAVKDMQSSFLFERGQ